MKEKHLKRTAKLLLIVYSITTFFGVVGMMSQLANATELAPIRSILPLVVSVVVFIGGIIVYIRAEEKISYIRYVGIGFAIVYFLMVIVGSTGTTYPYMLPIAVVIIYSMDSKAIYTPAITFMVTNVISIIITLVSAESPLDCLETVMIQLIITILFSITAAMGVKNLKAFFSESIEEVTSVADENKAVAAKIVQVADNVAVHADSMQGMLDDVLGHTDSVNDAMNNIVLGTDDTANAIQDQTLQTRDIQDVIDSTHESTEHIVSITDEAKVSLGEGTGAIRELFSQVDESIEGNKQMEVAATALQEKTEQVKGITDIIFGISSKTNLLALNASIEAARAGEAGRGFAVVAEEIRDLAEQTRLETENITALIEQLSQNAKEVNERVAANVESSNCEYKCAERAAEKFDDITSKINELSDEVDTIRDKVTVLRTSNNEIVDKVNTISATSEEISASTKEAAEMSNNNKAMLHDFADILSDLVNEIDNLKKM